jgi:LacI family transcriptional regulator
VDAEKPVRLQDIADMAGVSRATVSLALRNHGSIPDRTRTIIRDLARKLGYRPNPLVSALMAYQRATRPQRPTHLTLAVVVDFSQRGPWNSYLSEDTLGSAAARAELQGYRVEEFWLRDLKMTGKRLSNMLFRRGIPGIIVAPLPVAHGHLRLDWSRFSAVAVGNSLVRPALHRVTTNRFQAMRLAVRQLRRMGYRRMGLAMHVNQDARVDHQWASAFLWEQQQIPAAQRTPLFVVDEADWNEQKFGKWFDAHRPDVVLGHHAEILQWLHNRGFNAPEDVGFAHLWNPDKSGKYAGIYHNPPAIGAAAVDLLIGMIQRNECGIPTAPQTLLLEAAWQDGKTVARRPPRSGEL